MKYPNRIIKKGEKDKNLVTAIQEQLVKLGYKDLTVDGDFGTETEQFVKQFQSMHKDSQGNPLTIDGKIGSITWAALFDSNSIPHVDTASNSLLAEAVKVAISQIGVMEKPVGSNKGPEVNVYLKSVGLDPGYYWCAAFLYWCFKKAADDTDIQNPLVKTAGCLNHWNNTKGKKILAAKAAANPSLLQPGCIFIIDHGGGLGHTGIIERINGGFMHTIEGNSNDNGSSNGIGVFRVVRKINSVKGYIAYV